MVTEAPTLIRSIKLMLGKSLLLLERSRFTCSQIFAAFVGLFDGSVVVAGSNNRAAVPLAFNGRGKVTIGDKNIFGVPNAVKLGTGRIMMQARGRDALITIGSDNAFSNNVSLVAQRRIEIGNRCSVGDGVSIYDCDFHDVDPLTRNSGIGPVKAVSIGDNVWIGSRAIILKGVTVGENSVIGAMSLVAKSVPANAVVAGNPARVIRYLK